MPKKSTIDDFIKNSILIHGDKYDYSLAKYEGSKIHIAIKCKIHDFVFLQSPNIHLKGSGCPICGNIKKNIERKLSNDLFLKRVEKIHKNKYTYPDLSFDNTHSKINIKCDKHGIFKQKVCEHLNGKGCRKCFYERNSDLNIFIEKANIIYKNEFTYENFNYINSKTKPLIKCSKNHEFEITPNRHLTGKTLCKICKKNKYEENWIEKFKILKKFEYLSFSGKNVEIKCLLCNDIFIRDCSKHLLLKNCPCCNPWQHNLKTFIKKSKSIHGDKFKYHKVEFNKISDKIILICDNNHEFKQNASNHLNGTGCPECNSKFGIKENKWLNLHNIPNEYRQYKIGNYKVDGYDPNTKTIYEFNGDFWHGNPNLYNKDDINLVTKKTFGEMYERTIKREEKLKNMGYNLIKIWESEFDSINKNSKI